MKHFLSLFLVGFVFIGSVLAIDTEQIELVRNRTQSSSSELSASDMSVISQFWTTSLDQMLLSAKSQDAVAIRIELSKQKGIEPLSTYRSAYVQEGLKNIQASLLNIERLGNVQQRIMIKRNLLILTANLESPKTREIALAHLADEDDMIRYWAVRAVTQPAVVQQLSSDVITGQEAVSEILEGLSKRVSVEKQTDVLEMIAGFCMGFNDSIAREILVQMIDQRIKAYQNWRPVQVGLDIRLLTAAGNIAALQQDVAVKSTFGRKFTEMYSFAIQRYMKGVGSFTNAELEEILTVIAEVDQNVVSKTMEIRTGILGGLRSNTISQLSREYEILFGDRSRQGQLAMRLKFDYGKDAAGNPITSPPELKPKPEG